MFGIKTARHIIVSINKTATNVATTTSKALSTAEATHKTAVTTAGGLGIAKGVVDIAEDIVCQDYLCLTVDGIGLCADVLTCATSFVPGLNATSTITVPLSLTCKFFRWCCSKSIFSIGCKR